MKLKYLLILLTLCISSKSFAQSDSLAPIEVLVTDFNKTPKHGEQVLFVDQKSGQIFKSVSGTDGKFLIELPGGTVYDIKLKSIGKAEDYNTINIDRLGPNQYYSKMTLTIQYELPRTITLDNVHFETGKSSLTKLSYKELNEIVEFMKLRKDVIIEIAGHTDSVGDYESNLILSQARADQVMAYLISKGVDRTRLTAKGYGELSPVATNDTAEGRQKNRRTEVRIL